MLLWKKAKTADQEPDIKISPGDAVLNGGGSGDGDGDSGSGLLIQRELLKIQNQAVVSSNQQQQQQLTHTPSNVDVSSNVQQPRFGNHHHHHHNNNNINIKKNIININNKKKSSINNAHKKSFSQKHVSAGKAGKA